MTSTVLLLIYIYISLYYVKQIYLSGCPCKPQHNYFNVEKSAIFFFSTYEIFAIVDRIQNNKTITNTNIDK